MEQTNLPHDADDLAPDGSEVRRLVQGATGGMAHFRLGAGEVSIAKRHRSVEELWYFVGGRGEMCIGENVTAVSVGTSVRIPPDTRFQFRSVGPEPLDAVAVTMPPWPGPDEAVDAEPFWRADAGGSPRIDVLAKRVEANATWTDLMLPDRQIELLRQIAAQVRHHAVVHEEWGFQDSGTRGLGVSALFSGPTGTGKTMAARVLAKELGLDVYRVDLAGVIDKYVGDTEKHLRRVFDAAERSGAVLLFDEADALFGRRGEVKDSHDRYANIEVSYLLTRIESYTGLVILTTNLADLIDPAFVRRFRFVVEFPFPDAEQRRRIWEAAFPPAAPLGDIDVARLADVELTGGEISNVALHAAFAAADEGSPIEMRHVVAATRAELAKEGREPSAGMDV